jgi:hypothetical protein
MQKLVILVFTVLTFCELNPFAPSIADRYIQEFSSIAISEMHRTGIPASIKLAQGLLESDWGRSNLANEANNHFGIKCGFGWTGGTFFKEDDDYENGKLVKSCFRAYANAAESYIAHSDFLSKPRKSKRYDFLFHYGNQDYKSWAKGLQKAGYATDPSYPSKLIGIIEKYELYKYDRDSEPMPDAVVLESTKKHESTVINSEHNKETTQEAIVEAKTDNVLEPLIRMEYVNNIPMIRAREGETPLTLARRASVSYSKLKSFNEELPDRHSALPVGTVVYLKEKSNAYGKSSDQHQVKDGETMYLIAQQYGIKLENLYIKNRMPQGSVPLVGQKLNLGAMVKIGKRPKFKTPVELELDNQEFLFDESFTAR